MPGKRGLQNRRLQVRSTSGNRLVYSPIQPTWWPSCCKSQIGLIGESGAAGATRASGDLMAMGALLSHADVLESEIEKI